VVGCMTNGLKVPAGSEMVIEGFIEPGESCLGGAFGNHTGFYDPPRESPLMRVACITRRKEMIYPATVVGRPPMEDCWLAKASERLLLPMLRLELPEVVEINMPLEGIFHGCAIVAIEKSGPDHPREVMEAIWRGKWLGSARLLLMVDADSDICDISQVAWKVINLVDWRSDLFIDPMTGKNIPLGRLGLDATRKAGNAHGNVELSAEIGRGESIVDTVDRRWREYGF